jgi:hypothetical protein
MFLPGSVNECQFQPRRAAYVLLNVIAFFTVRCKEGETKKASAGIAKTGGGGVFDDNFHVG